MKHWSVKDIKAANAKVGGLFFSRDNMERDASHIHQGTWANERQGKVYFVTSEDFTEHKGDRRYTVRVFTPDDGRVSTVNEARQSSLIQAEDLAGQYGRGER